MKVYISADIEGITDVNNWEETEHTHFFTKQFTEEVAAACRGSFHAGAVEVIVKDAHDTGRNIIHADLPEGVKLIRGWSGHPYSMVQNLDESFDALIFIGYHSPAGSGGNPLSHTMSTKINWITLNGEILSEYLLHANVAAMHKVPVVFLSGDSEICTQAKKRVKDITTLSLKTGDGDSTISIHPSEAIQQTQNLVEKSLKGDIKKCILELPSTFELKINYKNHQKAYEKSYYPNAQLIDDCTIKVKATDYFEIMRAISFLL